MTDMTLTHEPPAPVSPYGAGEASPETPAPGGYPESTLCLRLDVEGIGLSWTLRGSDESMSQRLPRVLAYLKRLQAKLPKPQPAAPPAPPLEEREDWCPIHGVAMVQNANERGTWFSHKTPDGFCKGRRRKAGA